LLTNFGINSQDALTLAQGAKAALLRRLESRVGELADPKTWTSTEKVHYENQRESMTIGKEVLDMEDARKRDVMARLIDLTNANSGAVIAANLEKAMAHFARHEGDTGSPEVQGRLLIIPRLMISWSINSQDSCIANTHGTKSTG
jgi:hypothetical protein